jgi:hypothetical protein
VMTRERLLALAHLLTAHTGIGDSTSPPWAGGYCQFRLPGTWESPPMTGAYPSGHGVGGDRDALL